MVRQKGLSRLLFRAYSNILPMLKVEEALTIIIDSVLQLNAETVSLTNSLGRILAEDIFSKGDIPALDNSAMDGYALKSSDTKGASSGTPKILEVIDELKAGMITTSEIKHGQAIKIMTGAPIPRGADSVIMVEDTGREGRNVKIFKEVESGENIRKAGEDIKKGESGMQKGALLKAPHLGILAALGMPEIKVTRKPVAAILATGDELIDVGEKAVPGKLRTSNTYTLYSQVLSYGGIPVNLGIAKDEPDNLMKKIKSGMECDVIITSGGVSMGDYDLVKDVFVKMGADIKFWKIAMRPGKPILFGTIKGKPFFGLPGNPVSSMVGFEMFVRPAILKMSGQRDEDRKEADAILEEDIKKKKGLRFFLRAQTRWENGVYLTKTTGPQGSAILKSMMLANSLIILPEDEEYIKKGTKVSVRFLN
ncbi:MAG: molybdopterin molybdotransferase MoeA [Nitrospirae bacterium]|nr:molybdopterin molybdotransferase MoeA [Nitrospirota bacterium]